MEAHKGQLMKNLLLMVAQQNASDLHLSLGRYPTLRIDGKLVPLAQEKILNAQDLKDLSDLILNEEEKKELLANGEVDFSYNFEDKARFRTNVFFQKGCISLAMRLITNKTRTLEELKMPLSLYEFTKAPQGLVVVAGPIGQGKSTTLAALIDYINHNEEKHIITIEDPIEYVYEQDRCIIDQREVGRDSKSFHSALRAVFREDANVVLIGEMRDLDTIGTVITAAETGHLIFTTLHTNDSAQTVDRIIDVFPAHQQNQIRFQLANVLLGVVSQRLLPQIGGGRIPAVEIMVKNNAVGSLIREDKAYQVDNVIETSSREGMISLDKSLLDLVRKGLVTVDDAIIYAKNKDYFSNIN
jgi:twitching motility protein PilT